jgi:hypothetical protein
MLRDVRRTCMRSRIVVVGMMLIAAGCGDDAGNGAASLPPVTAQSTVPAPPASTSVAGDDPTIVARHADFAFYGPCGNSSIEVEGVVYFQLHEHEVEALDASTYPIVDGPAGFARVAPPGPGDDVGTLLVYSDGVARYESRSGTVEWFNDRPHMYNWVC